MFALLFLALLAPLSGRSVAVGSRLEQLRAKLKQENLDAYIIPNSDYHGSESPGEHDKRREWISGFTGSAGDAIVTLQDAALFTDSRYTIQAKRQLLDSWQLAPKDVNISDWILAHMKEGDKVGVDPKTLSYSSWLDIEKHIGKKGIELVETKENLIDQLWTDRPEPPKVPIFVHDIKFAGEEYPSKLMKVRHKMGELNSSVLVLSSLDEIAWLLNLRGGDSPFTPVFASFLILSQTDATLYVRPEIVTPEVREHLNASTPVRIKNYDDFWSDWKELAANCTLCFVPKRSSFYIYSAVNGSRRINERSPAIDLRAYKNPTEVQASRRAHISDAIALCRLFSTLEEKINEKVWYESDVSDLAGELRMAEPENRGRSFPDIIAAGSNAALPHYRPVKGADSVVNSSVVLLLDTGGQYLGGTTDTTRVLHLGTPRAIEIDVYTRLIKGVARLGGTVFPEGTVARNLDSLVRAPLYEVGLGYGHGSTHGTGIFLSVHEEYNGTYYENFIGSQEPGFYEENDFGMRLENLVVVVPAETKYKGKTEKKLFKFSPLTLVPYERKLINASILDESELDWLNNYHQEVRRKVGGEILKRGDQKLFQWLTVKTDPILKK